MELELIKPQLSSSEQIKHLKEKGIRFQLVSEEDAEKYLIENNNYFKLRSYRKSFEKYTAGDKRDTYINLDFGMLKDLSIIDMKLRYTLLLFVLDIEHFEKVRLLQKVSESNDDGYQIVSSYIASLRSVEDSGETIGKPYTSLMNEIKRNENSEYCGGIIKKYDGNYPVWAFVEIIPFGSFINFLKYCAEYLEDEELEDDFYVLKDIKRFRNAAAHNNCIIHNLFLNTSVHKTNYHVNRYLSKELGISKDVRSRRMSNAAIRDIVTLLYAHKKIVGSSGVQEAQAREIHAVIERCFRNIDYYKGNEVIIATFNFLKIVVDKMYEV